MLRTFLDSIIETNRHQSSIPSSWKDYADTNPASNSINWLYSNENVVECIRSNLMIADVALRQFIHSWEANKSEETAMESLPCMDDSLRQATTIVNNVVKNNINLAIEDDKSSGKVRATMMKRLLGEVSRMLLPCLQNIVAALASLVSRCRYSERMAVELSELCFCLFRTELSLQNIADITVVTGYHHLQRLALDLLLETFRRYSTQRLQIIFEFLPQLAEIYAIRPVPTSFTLRAGGGSSVALAFGGLLMILQSTIISSCTTSPDNDEVIVEEEPNDRSRAAKSLATVKKAYSSLQKYSSMFVAELLKRCVNKDVANSYRVALPRLIDELMLAVSDPHWPVASILLDYFAVKLRQELFVNAAEASTASSSAGKVKSADGTAQKRDTSYATFLLDCVSSLGCHLHTIVVAVDASEKLSLEMPSLDHEVVKLLDRKLSSSRNLVESSLNNILHNRDKERKALVHLVTSLVYGNYVKRSFEEAMNESITTNSASHHVIPRVQAILASSESSGRVQELLADLSTVDIDCYSLAEYLFRGHSESSRFTTDALAVLLMTWYRFNEKKDPIAQSTGSQAKVNDFIENFLGQLSSTRPAKIEFPLDGSAFTSKDSILLFQTFSNCASVSAQQIDPANYSPDMIQRTWKNVITSMRLREVFDMLLSVLSSTLNDSSPVVRSRVIRTLHNLMRVDRTLFVSRSLIKQSVTERLHDVSISVREETVKLIGYLLQEDSSSSTAVIDSEGSMVYIDALLISLRDVGVSVRKSVVTLLRDVLLNHPSHERYVEMSLSLLERYQLPTEEDNVKETIMEIFQQLWFTPSGNNNKTMIETDDYPRLSSPSAQSRNGNNKTPPTSVSLTPKSRDSRRSHGRVIDTAILLNCYRIIEVLLSTSPSPAEWIISLVRSVLHSGTEGNETNSMKRSRQHISLKHCTDLIQCLLEMLMICEESKGPDFIDSTGMIAYLSTVQRSVDDHLVAIFITLSVFCEAHPPLLVKPLPVFIPYLKPSSLSPTQHSIVCLKVSDMIAATAVVEGVSTMMRSSADEVITDLADIALKQSGANIVAAVRAMCHISAHIIQNIEEVVKLAEKCFSAIAGIASTSTAELTGMQAARIQRCLAVLGAICSNFRVCGDLLSSYMSSSSTSPKRVSQSNLTDERLALTPITEIETLQPGAIYGCCYAATVFSLSFSQPSVQSQAVQTLCSIFLGCPRLVLLQKSTTLLTTILSADFSSIVHEKMLQSLKKILDMEECRLEEGEAVTLMKEAGVKLGDRVMKPQGQDGDTTVAGFMLSQHLSALLIFTFSSERSLRLALLGLLGIV